jgi:hypothetical protein
MHLVVMLGAFLSLIMASLSIIGILTSKIIKREVLDRIQKD